MSSRRRKAFKPTGSGFSTWKQSKVKVQQAHKTEFDVKIVGGINEISASKTSLDDLITKLARHFLEAQVGEVETTVARLDQKKRYMKCKLKLRDVANKRAAFEAIRKTWFQKIAQQGDPFWLESIENVKNTFRFKADSPQHSFEPRSCSLGSFYDRGTFVEHYNTINDLHLIDEQTTYAEFRHDTKVLEVYFYHALTKEEIRLAFQYNKQFEEYVLVDEKTQGVVDIYIPLLRPPKVVRVEQTLDRTNDIRCVSFLNCTREILGNSCVLKLRFDTSDKPMELVTRLAKMSRTIYFCAVKTVPAQRLPDKPTFPDFEISYALECLLSRGFKVSDRITPRFYPFLVQARSLASERVLSRASSTRNLGIPSKQICRALYQLIAFVEANRFCPLETILEQLLFGALRKKVAIDAFENPKHYVYVPRIIITPTQNYLVQPELVAKNRVVREYGHEFAMRIAFRDEDFSKLTSMSDSLRDVLNDRVVGVLSKGIPLCGRHFQFLACSNSQLRDHGAWLYAFDGRCGAEDIRQSLGKLDDIRCVATYVSRMGQCFSSTKESVKISIDKGVSIEEIPDITRDYRDVFFSCCGKMRSGTYTFSDGIGKISEALAKRIATSLDLKTIPSAFQIRYAGCKGMLAIDKSLPEQIPMLQYRKSMRKFESQHEGIEICEHSKPNALYLNRQCITLLSGMGVKDEALIKLQDTMLVKLASMLLYENVGLETLGQTSVAGGLKAKVLRNSGIMVTCEPFFRSLLLAVYKSKLSDLLGRARIAIPHSDGRLLIGVLDESQTLEYGQVFIRYSKYISEPNKEYVTLTGQVVVTKNPCFHPGDLRKFQAVDVRSLYHLVDCIVFPSKGPRPHSDEISGSDLDGDKYFATWYKPLIPPDPNVEPMDFPSLSKRVLARKVEVSDMIEFVAEYIKNDQLGVIANAHLVHADSEDQGVRSEQCIKLAHMHSDAVDFPKTGECPSLPPELRPDQYPDFMMKSDKPRYKSKKVLGKLFQKCNKLERARYFTVTEETTGREQLELDQDLVVDGYIEYVESAIEVRDRYNTKLGSLMALYGLKDEGEVLTGCLTKVNSRISGKTDEKFEVAQLIQASLASIRNDLKHEFYEEFEGEDKVEEYYKEQKEYPAEVLHKASAWYVVTYNKDYRIDQREELQNTQENQEEQDDVGDEWSMSDKPLLSFPWIVSSLLAYIKSHNAHEDFKGLDSSGKELENIGKLIVGQTKKMFVDENLQETILEDLDLRQLQNKELLRMANSVMSLIGASLTGLNINDKKVQPLQVYIHLGWDIDKRVQLEYLRRYETYLKRSVRIKHISGPTIHDARLHYTRSDSDKDGYITADPYDMLKSFYVYFHIMEAPLLLPLLMVIMHWARKRYMTGSSRDSFVAVEDLAVLFIRFCERSKLIPEIPLQLIKEQAKQFLATEKALEDVEKSWKTMVSNSTEYTGQGFLAEPGSTLIKFWEFYGSDSESDDALHLSRIRSPVNPREKLLTNLSEEDIQRFTDASLHTFHEIAQRRGLDNLLKSIEHENLKEVTETLTMPNSTWGSLRFAEDFVAHGLSSFTKAKVNIRPAPKGGGYIMEVVGNYVSLSRCQAECYRLEAKFKGHDVYDHVISSGNRLFFLDQASQDDSVSAKSLKKGDFAVNLTSPSLSSSSSSSLDETKLLAAVREQLQVYNNCYLSYVHGSRCIRISLEYGSIYVANAHRWVLGTTAQNVEEALSRKVVGRKRKKPTTELKFVDLQRNQDIGTKLVTLGNSNLSSQETFYIVELKVNNNHKLKVMIDENYQFKSYQFEPFKWLDARLKSRRPIGSRSSDIDLRLTIASRRDMESTEAYQSLPIYETFGKTQILSMNNQGDVEVSKEYRRKATQILSVNSETHTLFYNNSVIFAEVNKVKKYNGKHPMRIPDKEYTTLKLFVDVDVNSEPNNNNGTEIEKLVIDVLHLGKILKP